MMEEIIRNFKIIYLNRDKNPRRSSDWNSRKNPGLLGKNPQRNFGTISGYISKQMPKKSRKENLIADRDLEIKPFTLSLFNSIHRSRQDKWHQSLLRGINNN